MLQEVNSYLLREGKYPNLGPEGGKHKVMTGSYEHYVPVTETFKW